MNNRMKVSMGFVGRTPGWRTTTVKGVALYVLAILNSSIALMACNSSAAQSECSNDGNSCTVDDTDGGLCHRAVVDDTYCSSGTCQNGTCVSKQTGSGSPTNPSGSSSSSTSGSTCSGTTCQTCSLWSPNCGWCGVDGTHGECVAGTAAGPNSASACIKSKWTYYALACLADTVGCPSTGSCSDCVSAKATSGSCIACDMGKPNTTCMPAQYGQTCMQYGGVAKTSVSQCMTNCGNGVCGDGEGQSNCAADCGSYSTGCKGKCASSTPSKTPGGATCYCDKVCGEKFDCCPDKASYCQ